MKRIALVVDGRFSPGRDGGSTGMLELLLFYRNQGEETHLLNFTTKDLYNKQYIFEQGSAVLKGVNIHQEILPYGINEIVKHQPEIIKLITRKISEHKIDYIYTVDSSPISLLPVYLSGVPGAHFFNSVDNIKNFANYGPIYIKILQKRAVFCSSKFLQMKCKELLDVNALVWNYIIDFNKYKGENTADKPKAIGFYSGGAGRKGDEIINKLIKKIPQYNFIVVGQLYSAYIKQLNPLPPTLKYLGHTTDMKSFYEQIKLLLVPSLHEEGFSRVIIEAAINGIPVMANRVGGIPEALGESGILIDVDLSKDLDIDGIADKYVLEINRLLGNDDEYASYSRKALLRAKEYEAEQTKMSKYFYENF